MADHLLRSLGNEHRNARLAAGLSLRTVERRTGLSRSFLSRLERGLAPGASVRAMAVSFAVLGMRLSARPYPEGPPLRDVAHARLLSRFKSGLAPTIRMRTEVPLRQHGESRAWDAELADGGGATCTLEAETGLYDLQAIDRRIALKMVDDGVERVILLVADTRRNRRVLREFHDLIELRYPLSTREVMRELRAGRLPQRSGVVLR
jgi:transcriptional regulator with XRE-family HTH domain